MLGRDAALSLLQRALDLSDADMTQATLAVGTQSLTRFANSMIHQNVSEKNAGLSVKAVVGTRTGYAVTNRLDDASIAEVVAKAVEFARHSQENPSFVSLPEPQPITPVESFDAPTAEYTPEGRADAAGRMIAEAGRFNSVAAGSFANGYSEFATANSLGVRAYNTGSAASLSTVMTAGSGHGYADEVSWRVGDLHPEAAAAEAASRSERSRDPGSVEPGGYDVILLPYAVAELVEFLAYLGFGALSVQEGTSFMRFGERITGENITIWDDGLDPAGMPRAFDAEGVPKQRVELLVNGTANAVVYDSYTAHKEEKRSTGHAIGGPGSHPLPTNLFMKPGDATVDEMIATTKRGVLVTRFHYTNVIHPTQTIIMGMTRDGTFLVEDGRITRPLMNLRFTDSILERLSNVEMIGKETKRQEMAVVPAIKARGFRFTGVTEF
ncbi:MAG: TldD/PmbA family protein [Armatimonadota bacterium]